ncbi:MAG: acyl carrier protein [Oscillospiraceae bacterium]|nr:acyl carrier protein [Oscillospiraceae bacterium]
MNMFEKISEYLAKQLDVSVDSITEETTFETLGVDSLDIVEMVMDLEESLGIELELDDKITTVGELAAFVESKL